MPLEFCAEGQILFGCLFSHPFLQIQLPALAKSTPEVRVPSSVEHSPLQSPSCIAAEEGIEHGLLHTLLILPTPGDHCPLTVGGVQMVAITGKRKAYNGLI